MKTSSDELFLLIKSLTTQEKVYFKAFSAKKRDSTLSSGYIKMFNVLDKMKVYNDNLLKSNLKRAGFNNNIKESKRRVTEVILKSLTDFHSDMNEVVQLQQLINRIYVLLDKKLLDLASKLLLKAKKIAYDYEYYEYLLSISRLEQRILFLKSDAAVFESYIKKEIDKKREYVKCLDNITEYENLSLQIEPIERTHSGEMINDSVDALRQILRHPLLQNSTSAITYESLKYFYSIKFRCAMLLNEITEDIYNGQKAWICFLEKDKLKLINRKINYLGGLNDILISLSALGNKNESENYFKKAQQFVQSLPPAEKTEKLMSVLAILFGTYISIQLKVPDPKKALQTWAELKISAAYKASSSITILILHGNLITAHFLLAQFKEALGFVNKVIASNNSNRIDIQQYARLLMLIINFELNKREPLPYLSKSAQRHLIKVNGTISDYDKCILNYFERNISEAANKKEEKKVFEKWKNELLRLPPKSAFFPEAGGSFFDFISWIESKIQNKPLLEILREKAQQKALA
ncbi:MAG: hypothetical protein HYU69_06520 [Bacteroidetes bacterium]|nr:hypothetical protein [Bacteroidota bacterium]